jgi:hypothetical protein
VGKVSEVFVCRFVDWIVRGRCAYLGRARRRRRRGWPFLCMGLLSNWYEEDTDVFLVNLCKRFWMW